MDPQDQMLDKLKGRMLELLQASPDPDREMAEIRRDLDRDFQVQASAQDFQAFVDQMFLDGPGLRMARQAVEQGMDPADAETPTDLLQRLLP